MKRVVMMTAAMFAAGAFAFPEVPLASAKALKITRGKKIDTGFVFVNGKYIRPPYVVERWGTGIRINGIPVTGEVIAWTEFLKTQSGVKVTKTEESPAPAPAVVAPPPPPTPSAPEKTEVEITPESLDALFDDAPVAKKPTKPIQRTPVVQAAPAQPKVTVSYALEGEFVENASTKTRVEKINAARTEIDRQLRAGGFVFFGDRYSRVVGDARTASQMMQSLPELMQHASSANALLSEARSANLYYLNEMVADDLYRNRVDYRKLQERRAQMKRDAELNSLMKRSSY